MTRDQFNSFCSSLKATTNVVQWGNASVWKVGGKIFAICSTWGDGSGQKIGFKCSDFSYMVLIEQEDIVPAPYLARAKWVQLQSPAAMPDDEIKTYITEAHRIIAAKLTKSRQRELGLLAS